MVSYNKQVIALMATIILTFLWIAGLLINRELPSITQVISFSFGWICMIMINPLTREIWKRKGE